MRKKIVNYIRKIMFQRQSRYIQALYQTDIDRYNACVSKKPSGQIKKEIKVLKKYWNCYPFQYFRFDMYHKNCAIDLHDMKNYLPYYFMGNLYWPYSYKQYSDLIKNKFFCYTLFSEFHENQAKILLLCDDGNLYDTHNNIITDEDVESLLQQTNSAKLFLKPNKGSWGAGITIFNRDENENYLDQHNQKLSAEYIRQIARPGDFILQEGIIQRRCMSDIYPHAVNTIRVITKCINQNPIIMYTVLRMGRGGTQVDNAAAGGLFINVDKKTGRLGEKAFDYGLKQKYYTTHPDTGLVFNDYPLDGWEEFREFMERNILKMRELEYIGWDIALTESGPLIVELNASPEMDIVQAPLGGLREDFNINPDKWFNKKDWYLVWKRKY